MPTLIQQFRPARGAHLVLIAAIAMTGPHAFAQRMTPATLTSAARSRPVNVVLVGADVLKGSRVSVLVEGGHGRPGTILLDERDATGPELATGLFHAQRLYRRNIVKGRTVRIDLPRAEQSLPLQASQTARLDSLLATVRVAAPLMARGYGNVRVRTLPHTGLP